MHCKEGFLLVHIMHPRCGFSQSLYAPSWVVNRQNLQTWREYPCCLLKQILAYCADCTHRHILILKWPLRFFRTVAATSSWLSNSTDSCFKICRFVPWQMPRWELLNNSAGNSATFQFFLTITQHFISLRTCVMTWDGWEEKIQMIDRHLAWQWGWQLLCTFQFFQRCIFVSAF